MHSFIKDQKLKSIKIILLGESGVGKTSIINAFNRSWINNKSFKDNLESTGCCSSIFKVIEIENKKYSLDIWDTAGQEKYRSLNSIFIKDSKIIILVYDITCKNTFEQLNYWLDFIHEKISFENIILGIIGNKSDLFEKEEISEEEGREYATKCGAYFSILSVKITKQLINSYFEQLVKMYLEKINKVEIIHTIPSIKITKELIIKKNAKKGFCGGGRHKSEKICQIKDDDSIKIIFIGDNGVGKTNIIRTIKGLELNKKYETTLNINEYTLTYTKTDKKYNIKIIDTNGDYEYHSEIKKVIKKCSIFILVFDLYKKETFNSLTKWINKIFKYLKSEKDCKLFLILGNRSNSNDNKIACVRKEDGIKFAKKFSSNYLETSIEEKQNLQNLIKNLSDQIINNKNINNV